MSPPPANGNRAQDAIDLVQSDVVAAFGHHFPPTADGGFRLVAPSERAADALSNATCTAVAWEYTGKHEKSFRGIEPTGEEVTFRAVTIVDHAPKPPTLARYVDWMSVMAQLGVSTVGRSRVSGRIRGHGRRLDPE